MILAGLVAAAALQEPAPASAQNTAQATAQGTAQGTAMTLQQALALAYRGNPGLLGQQAAQRAATEDSAQARSGWRPTVTANVNAVYQQGPYTGEYALGSFQTNDAETYLAVNQPIYTGGQVANKVRAADARSYAAGHALRLTEAQTFQTVVSAYMDVLRDRDILAVRQADLGTLTRQARLTTTRFNLGGDATRQVTRTDVEQAESQRDAAEAALAAAQAQLTASSATFRAAVGADPGPLTQPEALPALPATLPQAVALAQQSNPALARDRAAQDASAADIDVARASWNPTIGVRATLGSIGAASPFHGSSYDQEVTGMVTFSQPIESGGLYSAQIRQARDRFETARQTVEASRRAAIQGVVTAWQQVQSGMVAIRAGRAQVASATTALRGYQTEYGYGMRSTIDVLIADQNLRAAEVSLAESRHDTIVAEASLLATIGRLSAATLLPGERTYDPNTALRRARAPGWVPWTGAVATLDRVGWQDACPDSAPCQ
ncbi:TolC family outer membrane protein [Gluconacetobacter diazotrophicus]|uniref:TolC family outer membrane protein n=4 Tax=Gluconacetobacter diazotrophicus TaxID=33996 RepID=A0A7W4I697_GLUDI|nr:TolC family outer membrane protein [Gluconacetobacter diazotrophicus]CAP57662.1 putative outer membrane protein [Gluconacetobacter diazotrophicus PA1 5]